MGHEGDRLGVLLDGLSERIRGRLSAAALIRGNERLVSVVMTSYRTAAFIGRAITSLLDQTYRNLEVIVVDDASDDLTAAIVGQISREDERVRLIRCWHNRGTYWAKNLGMWHARGDYIAFQDSDDWSDPRRIECQVRAIETRPGTKASTCNYIRVNAAGEVVLNRGARERRGFQTLVMEKEAVLGTVGFFDQVRTAADDEYVNRLRRVFGRGGLVHIPEALYSNLVRPDSLTAGEVSLDLAPSAGPLAHLSTDRRAYVEAFTAWHSSGDDLHIEFPQRRRVFPAPEAMVPAELPDSEHVTASLASTARRWDMLQIVVRSLLPQVDRLNVFLNHYNRVPGLLDHPKIRVALSRDHGDLRDNGKYFFVEDLAPGYHFTVDDDIHYPRDYIAYGVAKLRQYGHAAVIGYHGRVLPPVITSFFDPETTRCITFKQRMLNDEPVHVLGTGTVAYHTSALRISFADFATVGMADVWLAVRAQEQQVPMIAVARHRGFLRPMEGSSDQSLFREFANADKAQTELAKRYEPWSFPDVAAALARWRGHLGGDPVAH